MSYAQSYKWLCNSCGEKITTPEVKEFEHPGSDEDYIDCCPSCRSENLSPIFHCEQCGEELDDHRSLCDRCEAEKYPKPIEITRRHGSPTSPHYIRLIYPDLEIAITKRHKKSGTEITVDGDLACGNMFIETYCKKCPTTRREVRKAIAEIHDIHAKLKGGTK